MSTLHAEQRRRAEQGLEVQRGLYRDQLRQAAAERQEHRQAADAASRRIAQLLPGAADAGLPIAEIARLTGQSRPTLYRLLAEARPQQDLSAQFAHWSRGLRAASEEVGHPALLVEFANSLGLDLVELRIQLSPLFDYGVERFDALGAPASIALIDLLPALPDVEKIILSMTFFQRLTLADISRSVDRPEADVIAWGVLGLLRVLPVVEEAESAQGT